MNIGNDRLALVVTVDRHDDPGLRDLAAPSADAAALAEVLGDESLGGFRMEFLHNPTSWTTCEKIDALLADRRPSDLVLLHFSGHGLKDLDGELYLAATNTVPDRLASTAVEAAWISRMMQRSRAQRVVLLLDCCYGGAFERGVLARADARIDVGDRFRPARLGESRGRVVITASTAMEYAFEGAGVSEGRPARPSVFTAALAEGIRTGEADRDRDGFIALDELYDYVYDRVRERSGHQTPCKWEFGTRGDLYVARSPFKPDSVVSLPPELLNLVAHPSAAVRLAAVHELAAVGDGGREVAHGVLRRLADDDSRTVSAAAAEALGSSPDRPAPIDDPQPAEQPLQPAEGAAARATPVRRRMVRSGAGAGLALLVAVVAGVTVNARGDERPPGGGRPAATPAAVASGHAATPGSSVAGAKVDRMPVSAAVPVRPAVLGRIKVGREPEGLAVSPDGHTVYVADQGSHELFLVDPVRHLVRARVTLPFVPRFVALSSDGTQAYVAMYNDDITGSGVAIVGTRTHVLEAVVPTGPMPFALAVAPDDRVWVPIHRADRVQVIDPASRHIVADIRVPPSPHAVAFGGEAAYIADHETNAVSPIDRATGRVRGPMPAGHSPHHLALTDDGSTAVVADYDGDTATIISLGSGKARATVRVGHHPQSVGIGGNRIAVVNEGGDSVTVLDLPDGKKVATLKVGRSPRSIAVAPDGRTAYVSDGGEGAVEAIRLG
ncbi:caspase family protein [Actinoplanes sp. NPDC051343]|uniref:caspase, EACC1-associated type n=1 Tax=Actinoplanes sp. NPDC051343 TaxID=3363906 RepID=UPI0037997CE4